MINVELIHPGFSQSACKLFRRAVALTVTAVGLLELVEWLTAASASGFTRSGMLPAIGLILMFTAGALFLWQPDLSHQRAAAVKSLSAAAVVTALFMCYEVFNRLSGKSLSLSQPPMSLTQTWHLGLAPALALGGFLSLNIAIVCGSYESRASQRWSNYLALFASSCALFAATGRFYGVTSLQADVGALGMPHATVLCIVFLGLAVLAMRPRGDVVSIVLSERQGGRLARHLLPAIVFLPVLIGWLRLRGQGAGWFGMEFGVTILVVTNIVIFSLIVWIHAGWLNRADKERSIAEAGSRELAAIVSSSNEAILSKDLTGKIVSWNKGAEALYGYTAEEIVGRSINTIIPPNLQAEAAEFLREVSVGREIRRDETTRIRKDGSIIQVSLTISPVRDLQDTITGASTIAHDITERKRDQDALRASQERLKGIIDSAMDAIVSVNSRQQIILFNAAAEKMFSWRKDEVFGQPMSLLIPPRFQATHAQHVERFGHTGVTNRAMGSMNPLWAQRANGQEFPIEASISQVVDNGEKVSSVILRDITERRQSEETLREHAELLNSTQTFVRDLESRIVFWPLGAQRLYGFTSEEVLGRRSHDVLRTIFLQPLDQIESELRNAGRWEGELRHRTSKGEEIVVSSVWILHRDGQGRPIRILESVVDITHRKRSEEAIRALDERFSKVFRSSPVAITVNTAADGRYVEANPAFLDLMGYERAEVIGRTQEELQVWANQQQQNELQDTLVRVGHVRSYEATFQTQSGAKRTVEISAELVSIDQAPCILATTMDVTEVRNLEVQFRQAQKMEAIGMLAGGVAHDFNNLLSVIVGYGELTREKLTPGTELYKHVEHIEAAAQRAASLTRQLLVFSRQQVLQPSVLSLNTVLSNFSEMLRRVIGEDVRLDFIPGDDLGSVKCDLAQVEQVLMNLVVNARDAMPNGGKIAVETTNAQLDEVFARQHEPKVRPGPYVMLSVSDTGCGMEAATLSRIFDPFFTTKPVGKGTGLGLPTVYGVVKQSGGHIWVYSEPNKGTTFKIYFPRVDEAAAAVIPSTVELSLVGGSETVLVVEDDDSLRDLTTTILRSEGYMVLPAKNGAEALEIAVQRTERIDVLLTDVIMPGMNGGDLADQLERLQPHIGVLFMSGYTANLIAHHRLMRPDTLLIQKPFTRYVLLGQMRRALGTISAHT